MLSLPMAHCLLPESTEAETASLFVLYISKLIGKCQASDKVFRRMVQIASKQNENKINSSK